VWWRFSRSVFRSLWTGPRLGSIRASSGTSPSVLPAGSFRSRTSSPPVAPVARVTQMWACSQVKFSMKGTAVWLTDVYYKERFDFEGHLVAGTNLLSGFPPTVTSKTITRDCALQNHGKTKILSLIRLMYFSLPSIFSSVPLKETMFTLTTITNIQQK